MGRTIEDFRKEGKEVIDWIMGGLNTIYKDKSKEEKNRYIESYLATPKSSFDILQSNSMGFIELDEKNSVPVINEEKLQLRMKGKNFEVLRDMLLNKGVSFSALDEIMELNGYTSIIYDYDDEEKIKEIKEDLSVIYTVNDDTEAEVEISFVILKDCSCPGYEENFYIKVTDFQKY